MAVSAGGWMFGTRITQSSILLGTPTHGQTTTSKTIDTLDAPSRISFDTPQALVQADTKLALVDDDFSALTPALTTTGELPESITPTEEFGVSDETRYVIREGDTLADIAEIFDISTSTIKYNNPDTTKGKLKAGTELIIPPIDGISYKIQKGDTFSGIAKKFDVAADDIADFNYILDRTSVVAGTTLFIPNGKPLPEAKVTIKTSSEKTTTASVPSNYSFSGSLGRPVSGPITSGYGMRSMGMHRGIDFGVPVGTPIHAAGSGYVKKAAGSGYNGGFGKMVVLGHGDYDTLYAHMSRVAVTAGQYVEKGQVIGYSGNTGRSTGPHLHLEVRVGGKPVNPTPYLK
ncbi:M23 family metallopeptidase [Candidatus Nomurabacteria bacterium]|nr:M23 family metallopeptidase [Candidatus Nomurabacteria bacterium]